MKINITKAKRLFAKVDNLFEDVPWLKHAPIREVAIRVFVLRVSLSSHRNTFNQMKEECKLIAKAVGKSWQTVYAYNLTYDIFQSDMPLIANACTVGSYGPLFIRFMDWGVPEGIGEFTENISIKAEDGTTFKSVGFHGFVGTVTAMGNGWVVAMNQSPMPGNDQTGVPSCYYTRLFAGRFGAAMNAGEDVGRAVKRILSGFKQENIHPMSSCILIVRNANHHGIIEFIPKRKPAIEIKSVHEPIAVSNHLNTKANRKFNPDEEFQDEDGEVYENTTYQRQLKMMNLLHRLARQRKVNLEKVRISSPIKNDLTTYSVLHNFETQECVIRKA